MQVRHWDTSSLGTDGHRCPPSHEPGRWRAAAVSGLCPQRPWRILMPGSAGVRGPAVDRTAAAEASNSLALKYFAQMGHLMRACWPQYTRRVVGLADLTTSALRVKWGSAPVRRSAGRGTLPSTLFKCGELEFHARWYMPVAEPRPEPHLRVHLPGDDGPSPSRGSDVPTSRHRGHPSRDWRMSSVAASSNGWCTPEWSCPMVVLRLREEAGQLPRRSSPRSFETVCGHTRQTGLDSGHTHQPGNVFLPDVLDQEQLYRLPLSRTQKLSCGVQVLESCSEYANAVGVVNSVYVL